MAKIKIKMEADYGFSCSFRTANSVKEIEMEVAESVMSTLKAIGSLEVSHFAIHAAIENGNTELVNLHEKISDAFYKMVEDYWLQDSEDVNECEYEALEEYIDDDMANGDFKPALTAEEFEAQWQSGEFVVTGDEKFWYDDEEYDDEEVDDETKEQRYKTYLMNSYRDWVFVHDNEFIAERVGCDLEACREDQEVYYTIYLPA